MLGRWLFKGLSLIWLSLYLLPAWAEEQVEESAFYEGALCILRADNKIVLVNEIITKQLSIPGGTIKPGELPSVAAKRETWEETGIVVTIGRELGRTDKAIVYDCTSSNEILAYQHQNDLGGYELPIWFAPDYGVEVSSATLIDPSIINSQHYRYPKDWENTLSLYEQATNQNIKFVADLTHMAPSFHQSELNWIQSFQQWVSSLPQPWNEWLHTLLLGGNILASPICGVILFPFLYWRCGKSVCYKVSFAISITSLVCLFAQQGFSLPRPHVYFPSIQLISSYGNGFPSLPIAVWSSIGILLMTEKERLGDTLFVALYFLSAIWLTVSKFYLGSAFIADMAVGGFLGLLITWNIIRFDIKKTERARTVMGSRRVWWGITFVAALFTYYWQLPVFAAWLVVLTVMSVITTVLKNQREYISFIQCVLFTAVLAVVYERMSYIASLVSSSGVWSLAVEISRYPAIVIVFVTLIKITATRRSKVKKPS